MQKTTIMRGNIYRLKPTIEQEKQFSQYAGVCRLVYNLALEQRTMWGKSHGVNYFTTSKELKDLRKEFDWIGAVSSTATQQALMDLDQAFQRFFKGVAHYPTPRTKSRHNSFRIVGGEVKIEKLNKKWSRIKLPKISWVKFRNSRDIENYMQVRNVTISLDSEGWYVSIVVKYEKTLPERNPNFIGIDRGVTIPMMLSNGTEIHLPSQLKDYERKKKMLQKSLSRKEKRSKRWYMAVRKLAKLSAKIARIRKHWQHVETHKIVNNFGVVAVEDLKTANMTKTAKGSIDNPGKNVRAKSGLNRSILDVGWYGIEEKLAYKLASENGVLVKIDPCHTSQICYQCGYKDKRNRKNQASFVCVSCGHYENADLNAAKNILRRGEEALAIA